MSILLTFPMKAETHIFVHAVSTQLYTLNLLHTSKIFFKARKSYLLESFFLRMPLKKFIYLNSRITYTHKRNREKIFHLPAYSLNGCNRQGRARIVPGASSGSPHWCRAQRLGSCSTAFPGSPVQNWIRTGGTHTAYWSCGLWLNLLHHSTGPHSTFLTSINLCLHFKKLNTCVKTSHLKKEYNHSTFGITTLSNVTLNLRTKFLGTVIFSLEWLQQFR